MLEIKNYWKQKLREVKMAFLLHSSSSSLGAKKLLLLSSSSRHFFYPSNPKTLSIRCQDSSSSSNSSSSEPTESTTTTSSTVAPPPSTKTSSSAAAGSGFGSTSSTNSVNSKKKQQGKKERASIIRRNPLAKPNFESRREDIQEKERSQNESAFLLAWFGLGAIIIVEGIVLAASGLLPEEWDKFFVKYLYPSFTPTVFLFVAGTVSYGVLKYLQNEKPQE